ncbi:GNAT family N-acetyltransferase [Actinocatenispora sera]|uniref:GNAT family N-acetyltransferase n=1 Tax=Actinocatenispora sera TaxID=390989 RepID=UPI0033EE4E37
MTTTDAALDVTGPDQLDALRADLVEVYSDAYAERIAASEFYSTDRYWSRITGYATRPGFTLATARRGHTMIGYALGFTLAANAAWWEDLRTPVDPDDIREDGHRTFAVCELMVRPDQRGRGYGHGLHDALLARRPEQRATLLVRPDNPVRDAYLRWGWRVLGRNQPYPDSPVYDAMVRDL